MGSIRIESNTDCQKLGLIQPRPTGGVLPLKCNEERPGGIPKLFTPFKIRGVEFPNKIFVSPMCMYSCQDRDGVFTDFHMIHLGTLALRGPGLVVTEATAVTPNGRITANCTGLYNKEQQESLKRIVKVAHASSARIAIQLAHAGRKGSVYPTFHNFEENGCHVVRANAPKEDGGFQEDLVAPSAEPWKPELPPPKALSKEDIKELVQAWAYSATLAVEAGVDLIEIHAAHGYLIHEFLSGNVNRRTDEYGGNLENRSRFLREIVTVVRAVMPESMPLFVRVSGTDYMGGDDELNHDPNGWDIWQVIEVCKQLVPLGVDVIDISSGGITSSPRVKMGIYSPGMGYQLPLAEAVKKANIQGLLVATVGGMYDAKFSEQALQDGKADFIFVGRQFLKDPTLVQTMADDLGLRVRWPAQYSWVYPAPK